jgi:hypothetical protein
MKRESTEKRKELDWSRANHRDGTCQENEGGGGLWLRLRLSSYVELACRPHSAGSIFFSNASEPITGFFHRKTIFFNCTVGRKVGKGARVAGATDAESPN